MKAIVTVVDDNGRLFCKDRIIFPIDERIVDSELLIKETRFNFTIREIVDSQISEEKNEWT